MHWLFGQQTIRACCLFLLLMATNGCVILPIPTPGHGGAGVITEESVDSLEAGKVTRADVLLRLGDPAERLQEDRFFVYRWELTHGYLMWAVSLGVPGAGTGDIHALTGDHFLIIEFLPDHRLRRLKFITPRMFHRTRDQVDELIKEWSQSSSESSL